MTETIETLDKRLRDIEVLITDIPEIINLRLENVAAAAGETTARIALLDKQMAMLTPDVRDIRSGVSLQLRLHREDVAEIKATLAEIITRLPPKS